MEISRRLLGYYPPGYRLINLDAERNLPTWYSSCLLLLCAGLLAIIAHIKHKNFAPYRYHWSFLSIIFLGLSLDETAAIHDVAVKPLRATFNLTGILYYSWVIPGIVVVALLGLAYLKFLTSLPKPIQRLFVLSAFIYVLGALGMEMIAGIITETMGAESLLYRVEAITEEFLELAGINLFIYTLLTYLCSYLDVRIYGANHAEVKTKQRVQ
ncbi:MAG TPA: hypothetical protein V6C65_02230 [Allocoleopsis sp.]